MSMLLELESAAAGNKDLSKYVIVEKGGGLDPVDPLFSERIFAHSLLKAGGTLALENLKIRELIFPLRLSAKSKPELNALVREINIILGTPGLQVEWRDEGATASTFFYVASGQLDVEFDFREGEKWMVKCKLRLFAQPLGVKENAYEPIVPVGAGASGLTMHATGPIVVLTGATPIAGDAPALLKGTVEPAEQITAMSVLPGPSYTPLFPVASSISQFNMTSIATVNALSGSFLRVASTGAAHVEWSLPFSRFGYQYVGNQRALLIARAPAFYSALTFVNPNGLQTSSVAVPTITLPEWGLYDLGVVSVPSQGYGGGHNFAMIIEKPEGAVTANAVDLAGLILLPENTTSWLGPHPGNPSKAVFDGLANTVTSGGRDAGLYARGVIPQWLPSASAPPRLAFLGFPLGSFLNKETLASAEAQPRTRYAF